jgi:hypothetical protein
MRYAVAASSEWIDPMGCVGRAARCTLGHPVLTRPFAGSRSVGLSWRGIRTSIGTTSSQSLAGTPTQYGGCAHAARPGPVRGETGRNGVIEAPGDHVAAEQGRCRRQVEAAAASGVRLDLDPGVRSSWVAIIEYQLHRGSA